ncbi:hypothetical protein DXT63_06255 [Thermoanaerobacteraceae bacterium SP2]|nr:hypothetical protein DXT63_06255 [Thermoanaerobacteraceae bacterium SP2]
MFAFLCIIIQFYRFNKINLARIRIIIKQLLRGVKMSVKYIKNSTARPSNELSEVREKVASILYRIRQEGDKGLLEFFLGYRIIRARVAGGKRIAVCSPPSRTTGFIHPATLVAMDIAEAHEI